MDILHPPSTRDRVFIHLQYTGMEQSQGEGAQHLIPIAGPVDFSFPFVLYGKVVDP